MKKWSQYLRYSRRLLQWGFAVLLLIIGWQFFRFVSQLESGVPLTVSRPAGVEAFLPISALISLKYWLLTGVFNTIHPASLVLLLIILLLSFILKKVFCSHVCPIGLISDYLARLHIWIFDRPRHLPAWLDYPLRSLKYLLLAFFIYTILFEMNVQQLQAFIHSPYNQVADIKMLLFFRDISAFNLKVIAALALLSVLVRYFWCRYLCPYGALLGLVSFFSPFKIRRRKETCIDCLKCTKVCPANIEVHRASVVRSDECHACLQCVDVCPVKNTLNFSVTKRRGTMPRWLLPVAVVLTFLIFTTAARLTGHWHNRISEQQYRQHIEYLDTPRYQHNRGRVADDQNFPVNE